MRLRDNRTLVLAVVLVLLVFALRLGWEQTDPEAGAQEDCREVATFGPSTESQTTPPFEITGNTFRLSGEATGSSGPNFLLQIFPKDETDQAVTAILRQENGPFDENVLQGPGSFTLDIQVMDAEYTIRVEDCGASPTGGLANQKGGGTTSPSPPPRPPSPPSPPKTQPKSQPKSQPAPQPKAPSTNLESGGPESGLFRRCPVEIARESFRSSGTGFVTGSPGFFTLV